MNYLKYFQNDTYNRENQNCWHLFQQIYEDEHKIKLPDIPIFHDEASFLIANIKHREVDKAFKGVAVHVKAKDIEHIGYALNEKEYIHKSSKFGVKVSRIPKNAKLYEILEVL